MHAGSTLLRLGAIAALLLIARALLRDEQPEVVRLEPPGASRARARQRGKRPPRRRDRAVDATPEPRH
jgi:hypothetical protein